MMDYEDVCRQILGIDEKIRYVGIYDYSKLYRIMREGVVSHLTDQETEVAMLHAVKRWANRKKMAKKIGMPVYSVTKYGKIFRIVVPTGGAGLMLVSTELDADAYNIAQKVSAKVREIYD